MDHADMNHRLAGFGVAFVIFAVTTAVAQPSEGAFDNPALRQHLEAANSLHALHLFDRKTERVAHDGGQPFAAVGRVVAVGKAIGVGIDDLIAAADAVVAVSDFLAGWIFHAAGPAEGIVSLFVRDVLTQ